MPNVEIWVPKNMVKEVIQTAHCPPQKCHGDIAKTLERLRPNFVWPKMVVDVKSLIANYEDYQKSKSSNFPLYPLMLKQYLVHRPFERLYIDLLGPYRRTKSGNIRLSETLN